MPQFWIESRPTMKTQRPSHGGIGPADLLDRMLPGGSTSRQMAEFLSRHEGERAAAMMRDSLGGAMNEAGLTHVALAPSARTLREALGLSREAFAERFEIPLPTLTDWESGRAQPDGAARAYLKVIARNPDAVRDALATPISFA